MKPNETPWPGQVETVRQLGQSWAETRFGAWLLLDLMPELEADPSEEGWDRVIPIQQHLYTAGSKFEIAAQELLASDEEWVDLVMDAINEMRRTLIAETEWAGARMRLLTERENRPAWPFPFHTAIR